MLKVTSESFSVEAMVHDYHVYEDVWEAEESHAALRMLPAMNEVTSCKTVKLLQGILFTVENSSVKNAKIVLLKNLAPYSMTNIYLIIKENNISFEAY